MDLCFSDSGELVKHNFLLIQNTSCPYKHIHNPNHLLNLKYDFRWGLTPIFHIYSLGRLNCGIGIFFLSKYIPTIGKGEP